MNMLKRMFGVSCRLLMACMFAVCMVVGVVPILPKRKEPFEIEIKMEDVEKEDEHTANFIQ